MSRFYRNCETNLPEKDVFYRKGGEKSFKTEFFIDSKLTINTGGISMRKYGKWVFLGLILLGTGCAGGGLHRQTMYMDSGFQFSAINEITLLPTVDVRSDKKVEVDIQKQITEPTMENLKNRGYKVGFSDKIGDIEQISENALKTANPAWIKRLGPPEARWVMVVTLVDVRTKMDLVFGSGSTGQAEVAGFLYDKESGKMVWQDKGSAKRGGGGGLLGMALNKSITNAAISGAVMDLFASIPYPKSK